MKYNQPYGVTDPAAPYVNGDPSTGTMGSIPPAAAVEYPQREIVALIAAASLTPDNADLTQLAKAVQSGKVIYAVDQGPANLLSIALNPPLGALVDGMAVWVRANHDNTGPSTLAINAIGGRNIIRRGGGVLQAGDIKGGFQTLMIFNGPHNNFELYGATYDAVPGVPVMVANTNLYVDTVLGSDTLYDGTSAAVAAPHGPFKTIGRAVTETFKYGPSVYTMTVNVAAGTYPEAVITPPTIGPRMVINGAGINATFVTGANNQHTFNVGNANQMTVSNLHASTGSGPGLSCFEVSGGATLITNNTASGVAAGYVWSAFGGYLYIGTHTFKAGGSAIYAINSNVGGYVGFLNISGAGPALTFAGAYTFSTGFCAAVAGGIINCGPPVLPTFPGAGTYGNGYRYIADSNGVINTEGQSVSFFPGTIAGYTNRGGQYT